MRFCQACGRFYTQENDFCPRHGIALEERDEFAIGGLVCGRYRVVESIGAGNMGEVFLVRDEKLFSGNNQRAMKVPLPHMRTDREFLARFMSEADRTLALHHENIVQGYNVETTDAGTPLLLMKYLEGHSLRWWMDREPKLQWRHVRDIALQIARALESAHAQGVVHCDVKPESIKSRSKQHPTPLEVFDFGLAKAAQTETAAGQGTMWGGSIVAGTLNYMSPEQAIARDRVGPPSDIYSLGVVLHEIVTGSLPYRDIGTVEEARTLHAQGAALSIRPSVPVPAGVPELIRSMLEREPARRPNASEVVERLTNLPATLVFDSPPPTAETTAKRAGPPPLPQPPKRRFSPALIGISAIIVVAAAAAALILSQGKDAAPRGGDPPAVASSGPPPSIPDDDDIPILTPPKPAAPAAVPAPVPVAAPQSPTSLAIVCRPECRRYVASEEQANTEFRIAPGRYAVKVVMLTDASISEERVVTVVEGQRTTVSFDLAAKKEAKREAAANVHQQIQVLLKQAKTQFDSHLYADAIDTLERAASAAQGIQESSDLLEIKNLKDQVFGVCKTFPAGTCGPRFAGKQ